MALILDTGALIAFDRGDKRVAAVIERARQRRTKVLTSSGCVAQAWREGGSRQARLARLLDGVDERGLGPHVSRVVGGLCANAGTIDVVDAHLALLVSDADVVLSSDTEDLQRLLQEIAVAAEVAAC